MNDHFTPVGKPAPPRPRSPDSFTMPTISAGDMPSAFCSATYPPRLRQPSRPIASLSPKYLERTTDSRSCGGCGNPMSAQRGEERGHRLRRHRLDELLIDHHRRGEAARAETFHLDHRVLPVGGGDAELLAARVLEEGVHDILGATDVAGRRRADLDEVLTDRVLVVHRVERHDALHVRRREIEHLGHLGHRVAAHPAALFLHDPERREQRRHLLRVAREELVELGAPRAGEDGDVRTRLVKTVGQIAGSALAPHLVTRRAHRSISPMTMSMLALIAITSDNRWPSTIFGIADRFTNDGGRMRQRTGFDVPSDTM